MNAFAFLQRELEIPSSCVDAEGELVVLVSLIIPVLVLIRRLIWELDVRNVELVGFYSLQGTSGFPLLFVKCGSFYASTTYLMIYEKTSFWT